MSSIGKNRRVPAFIPSYLELSRGLRGPSTPSAPRGGGIAPVSPPHPDYVTDWAYSMDTGRANRAETSPYKYSVFPVDCYVAFLFYNLDPLK